MRVTLRIVAVFWIFLVAPQVRGQASGPSGGAGQNAALQYWMAFNFLPQDEAGVKRLGEWKTLSLEGYPEKMPASLQFLHAGAEMKQCDWGVDLGQGPYTLLPFLNKSRTLTYEACLRVRFDISRKRWSDAVEHGCDALVAARQVANPPIMISLLVSYADERDVIDALATGLNSFDRESLMRLSARLDALPTSPAYADSLSTESALSVDWAIRKVKEAGPHPRWEEIFGFLTLDEGKTTHFSVNDLIAKCGGTPEGVVRQLEGLREFYREAQALARKDISREEFNRQAQALLSRYDGNPFAKPVLPLLPKLHDEMLAEQTRMTLLRAAIAVAQDGPGAVKRFSDPGERQAIAYEARPGGFTLTSKMVYRNQPLSLTVGPAK